MNYYVDKIRENPMLSAVPTRREMVYLNLDDAVRNMYHFLHSRNSNARMIEEIKEAFKETVFKMLDEKTHFILLRWLNVWPARTAETAKRENAIRQELMPAIAHLRTKFPERAPGMPRNLEERSSHNARYEDCLKKWDEAFLATVKELETDDAFAHRALRASLKAQDIVYKK